MLNSLLQPFQVGDIYISLTETNPASKFGGTWRLSSPGKTLICIDSSDTDFNTAGKIGGFKTHSHESGTYFTEARILDATLFYNDYLTEWSPRHKAEFTQSSGGNTGTTDFAIGVDGRSAVSSNLQPYITCYIWQKVA